jgi:hypothetical protein
MQMPPTGALSPEQIQIIKAWIDQGAEWPDSLANEADARPPDPKAVAMVEALRNDNLRSFLRAADADPQLLNARGPDLHLRPGAGLAYSQQGFGNARICPTAAEIPAHPPPDVIESRRGILGQKCLGRHDKSRGAVSTLGSIRIHKRLLQRVQCAIVCQRLYRRNLQVPGIDGQHGAGVYPLSRRR